MLGTFCRNRMLVLVPAVTMAVGCITLTGCKNDENSTNTAPGSSSNTSSSPTATTMPSMPASSTPDVSTTRPSLPDVTTPTVPQIPATLPAVPEPTGPTTVPSTGAGATGAGAIGSPSAGAGTTGAGPSAAPTTGPSGDAETEQATTQAKGLMGGIQEAVKAKKWDDAENMLKKLQDLKSKLPENMQRQVDAASAMVKTEKATGGLKLPGLPGAGDQNK